MLVISISSCEVFLDKKSHGIELTRTELLVSSIPELCTEGN
jgi:hypothetical protein